MNARLVGFGAAAIFAALTGCSGGSSDSPAAFKRALPGWIRVVNLTSETIDGRDGQNAMFTGLKPMSGLPFAPLRPRKSKITLVAPSGETSIDVPLTSGKTATIFLTKNAGAFRAILLEGEPRQAEPNTSLVQVVRVGPDGVRVAEPEDISVPASVSSLPLKLSSTDEKVAIKGGGTLSVKVEKGVAYTAVFPDGAKKFEPFLVRNAQSNKPQSAGLSLN